MPNNARRPGTDWVVPLDGIADAPLAKLAALMGGAIPPVAPAGQVRPLGSDSGHMCGCERLRWGVATANIQGWVQQQASGDKYAARRACILRAHPQAPS